jgi:diaminohydroxyphosphoribosylaminopyrimidine deaminase / 5-amino-6-(5-phosphoribosylamino)uracil reductase
MATDDTLHMARALALAERGRGRTSPNPMVGAVIVDDEGVVVGRGSHEFAGGPHAEIHAFAEAGARARGSTLYCTLEPCSHTGRTGPCAPRVVAAGIRRAVIAVEDPNPQVQGRGLAHLREHGIEVSAGVMREAAGRLNAPFFTAMQQRRPFITMKVALSREGFVAGPGGQRVQLTGPAANRFIHRERAEVDAIAVGSGTVIADDPVLTARGAYRTRPLTRVVFDRGLRTPPGARLLATAAAGPIIIIRAISTAPGAAERATALQDAGAQVELIPAQRPERFLSAAMSRLTEIGVSSVVVEGGPRLHAALWDAKLVDRVQVFKTRAAVGPDGVGWLDPAILSPAVLEDVSTLRLGDDEMMQGYVHRAR